MDPSNEYDLCAIQPNRHEVHIWSLERRLALTVDFHLANVPNIIGSCIVLHNICKTHGDPLLR